MSYHVFFALSTGLSKPMLVPHGTLAALQEHVAFIEQKLGWKAEKYLDNPAHWRDTKPSIDITDEDFCNLAIAHNRWVRWLYYKMAEWQKATPEKPPNGWWERRFDTELRLYDNSRDAPKPPDTMTPEDAATIWHALVDINVPVERWSMDYYRERMEHVYEVLRGKEHEGVTFDAKALTPKQAAAVIRVFSEFIDSHDLRLDVPNGRDYIASSYDGGYTWCEKCGPKHPDDIYGCRGKGCPVRAERGDLSWVLKDKAAGVYMGRKPDEWPAKLGKAVRHFDDRDKAEKTAKKYKARQLVVVPVGRRDW